jgi:ribosomal-protein-alanine N-acetyltransferase
MITLPFRRKRRITVTGMERQHLSDAAAIHAAGFRDAWGDGTLANMLGQRGMTGLVALGPAGKVCGFLVYRTAADEVEVITIATAPKARRTGAARALMSEMIRRCLLDRCEAIFLEVDEANKPARALYAGLGFRQVGERKGYYQQGPGNAPGGGSAVPSNALILRLDLKRSN